MSETPLSTEREYLFKFASKTVTGKFPLVNYQIDVNTQDQMNKASLELNDIGMVEAELSQEVLVDPYAQNRATGAFIVIDRLSNITVAAGMVATKLERSEISGGTKGEFSEFEVELNALVRKHFPHWGAVDLRGLEK